jgi:hypothetical protein
MVIFVAKLMEVLHLHAKPVNKIKPLDSRLSTLVTIQSFITDILQSVLKTRWLSVHVYKTATPSPHEEWPHSELVL